MMKKSLLQTRINILKGVMFAVLVVFLAQTTVSASSHREAPLISLDPFADNTDLYAFRSPDDPNTITIIASYVPFQLPQGGPNWYGFSDHVRYEIHIDNDAGTPGDEVTYYLTFTRTNEDPTTFFNIRLGAQNIKTTYTLERSTDGGMSFETILTDGIVPPPNIGPRSIESAVGLGTTYEALIADAIMTTSTGERVFCGPSDDPFYADLGGIFDLGNAPRQDGDPRDGVGCLNVSTIAIQIPISTLLKDGAPSTPTNILDADYVIGVWASASRKQIRTFNTDGPDATYDGPWVQVSRLGMPLTNEAVVPIGQKDYWNAISPYDEITDEVLDPFFYNPELALYMDDDQFGGAVPAFEALRIQRNSLGSFDFGNGQDGLFGLKGSDAVEGTALDDAVFGTLLLPGPGLPRSVDLWPIFHTGAPNFPPYQLATGKEGNPLAPGKPFIHNFLPNGGDMLRLNMATPVTPRNSADFSALGVVNAAVLGLTDPRFNGNTDLEMIPNMDGFPNGRRLEDDVTRIELQAVSGIVLAAVGLWYDDFDGENPVSQDLLDVLTYTTGVESNDVPFKSSFPYVASPFSAVGDCSGVLVDDGGDDGMNPLTDADLELSITTPNTNYRLFGAVPFTITLTNKGPLNATGITVSAPLPAGLVYSNGNASAGSYDNFTGVWNVGVMAPGQTVTLQQNLFSVGTGEINNFVQVQTSSQNDPDSAPGNDTNQTPDEDDESLATVRVSGNTASSDTDAQLFVSSNTEGIVGVFNIFADNSVSMVAKQTAGVDADGIHYDGSEDRLIQLNRSDNRIDVFSDVNASLGSADPLNLVASSTSDFSNGREIAVNKDWVIAAQDANDGNGNVNKLAIYTIDGGNSVNLLKTHEVDINLWGIHVIGSTLWAVIDNSNQIAIYDDIFTAAEGPIMPSSVIEIDGIIRTHGLTYITDRDMLILTDVGAGTDPDDGAFVVVRNLTAATADARVTADEQVRIEGDKTFLGNPVDVAYDDTTDRVFLAERANGGGRVLGFPLPTANGNVFPNYNREFAGASAIFFSGDSGSSRPAPVANASLAQAGSDYAVGTIFPVPAKNIINATMDSKVNGMVTFMVYDTNGKAISNFNHEVFSGMNKITFDISDYPSGYYYLKVLDTNADISKLDVETAHKFLKVD